MNKPNIVYILADDMGYGDMGCNNPESKIPTPNLDALAGQGVRFTDAHAPSSVCTPTRYTILTGRYCWRTRLKQAVLWPWDPALIEPDRFTVADLLRANGYRTACIGKWHLGWDWATKDGAPANQGTEYGVYDQDVRDKLSANIDFTKPMRGGPIDCGFDYYFGDDVPNFPPYTWFENDRVATLPTEPKPDDMFGHRGPAAPGWQLEAVMPEITRRAVRYIDESGDAPFFLYFPLTAPHMPIVPTAEFRGRSQAGEYGDYVCEVDWAVGQVIEALERRGIADNTLVIFTSDNGPEHIAYPRIREHGHYSMAHFRGIKRDTWEGGHRVPFIARWPGVAPAGAECDALTTHGDFMATCADLLGAELPAGAAEDSVSMLPLFKDGLDSGPVRTFAVHHSCSGRFAIRKGDWVFIDAPSGDDNREPAWFKKERGYAAHDFPGELFNLKDDIAERVNRYGERPEVVAELLELLSRVKAGHGPSPAPPADGIPLSE
ncbi:MAG: arylsulfatase [Candidatus Hydrogenedentes bacterium]|nr:arylsulfatase [Candidatus Hydrogenedentota bacterium]